jgi:hypothetical protein
MPSLEGPSAEFIRSENTPIYEAEIIDLNALTADSLLIGHILGGIKSVTSNPFTNNQTEYTSSNSVIYEVWLKRTNVGAIEVQAPQLVSNVNLYPNPAKEVAFLAFELAQKANVECFITDANGSLVHEVYYEKIKNTKKTLDIKKLGLQPGNYTIQLIFNDQQVLTKQLCIQ